MKGTKCIFFDLDGTLTDSEPGLAESFTYIFNKYGVDIGERSLRQFFGPPISQSLSPYFSTKEEVEAAVADYREHYRERYLTGNSLYAGIVDMLDALKSKGYALAVVTGKPEATAEDIVRHFHIRKYFDAVCGVYQGHTEKIETLNRALELHSCPPDQAVMIGDRMYDLEAAMLGKTAGIGVLWGYGTREELEAYDSLFLANSPLEIVKYFEA
ncbi:MAG: HAD hydrolase-like protein [Defluviitaleaceae bacterium]|nr:HAD hydrolase-like protein [Defluviitaleaceae bacterium]